MKIIRNIFDFLYFILSDIRNVIRFPLIVPAGTAEHKKLTDLFNFSALPWRSISVNLLLTDQPSTTPQVTALLPGLHDIFVFVPRLILDEFYQNPLNFKLHQMFVINLEPLLSSPFKLFMLLRPNRQIILSQSLIGSGDTYCI